MKTTIRLLDRNKDCVHEFDTASETDTNDILLFCDRPYLFEDQGTDENGAWEEWVQGRFVDATPRLTPKP